MTETRGLQTRKGCIPFPAYIPVTTFGKKYPLDNLIRPYLPRLAPAVMVSYHYAQQMEQPLRIPMMVDSGGFASLFDNARVRKLKGLGILEYQNGDQLEKIHPRDVLHLQENIAEVAFTLDFPIPPKMRKREARRRFDLTIANSFWALANRRRKDLPLYACLQYWDVDSARECAKIYAKAGFEGVAIGGLVPRARNVGLLREIVEAVRSELPQQLPLHVLGIGKPTLVEEIFRLGVDSVDSSSYVKMAVSGAEKDVSPTERLRLALGNLAANSTVSLPLSAANFLPNSRAKT